jgi:hypothetical protein
MYNLSEKSGTTQTLSTAVFPGAGVVGNELAFIGSFQQAVQTVTSFLGRIYGLGKVFPISTRSYIGLLSFTLKTT